MEEQLLAISPLDGRYRAKVENASHYFSEAALMRYRCLIEVEWFIFLFNDLKLKGTKSLQTAELRILRSMYEQFDVVDARRVKEIEKTTNHDVKAIEYFIKEHLKGGPLESYGEFVHFACTSEDINNLAYACMVRDFTQRELMPSLSGLIQELHAMAVANKGVAMLSRTHGQTATPTTLGKELINVVARLEGEFSAMSAITMPGKINGAVGNYNAHLSAYPKVDWPAAGKKFVESLGLEFNEYTTQIEPHDVLARLFDSIKRVNTIVLDFDRDIWTYISMGYFGQKVVKGEVGSSTMPHKVNPIDFENSEGNLGISSALLEHMARKLPVSRMQRDLTDSTVLRNVGSAMAYALLGYKSTIRGLAKCEVRVKVISDDLKDRWEVLAEPVQVVMRAHGIEGAYEKLKALTRGKAGVTKAAMQKLIKSLEIPATDKKRLMALTPEKYVGLAEQLVEDYELVAVTGGGCGPSGCGGCQGCG